MTGYYATATDPQNPNRERLMWCPREKTATGSKSTGRVWLTTTYPHTRKGDKNLMADQERLNCSGGWPTPPTADQVLN